MPCINCRYLSFFSLAMSGAVLPCISNGISSGGCIMWVKAFMISWPSSKVSLLLSCSLTDSKTIKGSLSHLVLGSGKCEWSTVSNSNVGRVVTSPGEPGDSTNRQSTPSTPTVFLLQVRGDEQNLYLLSLHVSYFKEVLFKSNNWHIQVWLQLSSTWTIHHTCPSAWTQISGLSLDEAQQ